MTTLFEPARLGRYTLSNRVVMAPMTRSRAIDNVPNDLMAEYYRQRATAGLIITEGTSPSPNGLGYPRIPGLFSDAHVVGWKKVTEAVHTEGGHLFVQLMHTGRVAHPLNLPKGGRVLAPSALAVSGNMWTDTQGLQPYPTPEAMSEADIAQAQNEYVRAAELAIDAGFDGVELHAANGYLLEQFLNPNVNQRTDAHGKDTDGRQKFLLDVATETANKIGKDRLGVRISPYGVFNDTGAFHGIDTFYALLAERLSAIGIAYIHVVDHSAMGAPTVSDNLKRVIRERFKGAYLLSGGYDRARAERDLSDNKGDLVVFGRPFLANPNLVEMLKTNQPLKDHDETKLYTPGEDGYTVV